VEKVRIVQIIPAQGWWAVYRKREDDGEFSALLVSWALVEGSTGEFEVVGIDADIKGTVEIAAYANNFLRYEMRTLFLWVRSGTPLTPQSVSSSPTAMRPTPTNANWRHHKPAKECDRNDQPK
jgi:hypothetical protein